MAYDIAEPYGPLIETTLRLVSWNVWARFGPWEQRETAIRETLERHDPDIVALVEAWGEQGRRLGMPHHVFAGEEDSGLAVLSRWPIERHERRTLSGPEDATGAVLFARIAGPRGPIQLFLVSLTWRLEHSAVRQEQVREAGRHRLAPTSSIGMLAAPVTRQVASHPLKAAASVDGARFEEPGSYNGRTSAKLGVAHKGDQAGTRGPVV